MLKGLELWRNLQPKLLDQGPGCRWEFPGHFSPAQTPPPAWSPGSPGDQNKSCCSCLMCNDDESEHEVGDADTLTAVVIMVLTQMNRKFTVETIMNMDMMTLTMVMTVTMRSWRRRRTPRTMMLTMKAVAMRIQDHVPPTAP